jgi:hypothetical protein
MTVEQPDESISVAVEVVSIEQVQGQGRLTALVTAALTISGVEIELSGIRLVRLGTKVGVEMPKIRDSSGREKPILKLPLEIDNALREAVHRYVDITIAERREEVFLKS